MIVRSVRRQATIALRKGQAAAAADEVPEWMSRGGPQSRPGRQLVVEFFVGLALACGSTYFAPASWGLSTATTGFLTVLWQVQAASVSLTLALAVFVFGLLPQSRARVTYPVFLKRSWALQIVVLGVVSILLNGIVLLGAGFQLPAKEPGGSDGHGWAVTVAVIVALCSVAAIAFLFAKTISAIDPATTVRADSEYREQAVGQAIHDELFQQMSIKALEHLGYDLTSVVALPYRGRAVVAGASRNAVVRDVSLLRLGILRRYLGWRKMSSPVVLAWPGRQINGRTRLMSLDERAGRGARWFARRCFQVRAAHADALNPALAALLGDAFEQVRADRPVEAKACLETLAALLEQCWQGYTVYGLAYDETIARTMPIWYVPVILRITSALHTMLRAAAVSRDEQIRIVAVRMPHRIAARAIEHGATASIPALLKLHQAMYDAVVDDLTDSGRTGLPTRGAGRGRINRLLSAMLSFSHHDIARRVDFVGSVKYQDAPADEKTRILRLAELAVAQMTTGNEAILALLCRAIVVNDIETLRHTLPLWRIPQTTFVTAVRQADDLREERGDPGMQSDAREFSAREQRLVRAWRQAGVELDAMRLRLLGAALSAEKVSAPLLSPPPTGPVAPIPARVAGYRKRSSASTMPAASGLPDQAVATVLQHLRPARLWQAIATAVDQADHDELRETGEDEINPMGALFFSAGTDTDRLLEVFVRAAILRPELTARQAIQPSFARVYGEAVARIAHEVASQRAWFARYDIDLKTARSRAEAIGVSIGTAADDARCVEELKTLATPLPLDDKRRIEADARNGYSTRDILSRLLHWAGNPARDASASPSGIGELAAWQAHIPRGMLLDILAQPAEYSRFVEEAAEELAGSLLKALLSEVPDDGMRSPVPRSQTAAAVKTAIARLRSARGSFQGLPALAPGICVVVPNDWSLTFDLELSATSRNAHAEQDLARERAAMIDALGLNYPGAEWALVGIVDGVPAIRVNTDVDRIIVVDLSRFATVHLMGLSGITPEGARLEIREPTEASVRNECEQAIARDLASPDPASREAASAPHALEDAIRGRMLMVEIWFAIDGTITVEAPTAATSIELAADT